MAETTDYVARSIFVEAMHAYFGEESEAATEVMVSILADESNYSTLTVLRAAGRIGRDAIDVFTKAMKSRSEESRGILVNYLFTLSEKDAELFIYLLDHYYSLVTPASVIANSSIAMGALESVARVLLANIHDQELLQRCSRPLQESARRLHLLESKDAGLIESTVEAAVKLPFQFLLDRVLLRSFFEVASLWSLERSQEFLGKAAEQQKLADLLPFFESDRQGFSNELANVRRELDEAPHFASALTSLILAIHVIADRSFSLDSYRKLYESCSGVGRSWMLTTTFAHSIPLPLPKGYLELLEELVVEFVHDNRVNLFEERIVLHDVIYAPFLSLYMSYYREGISDMPVAKSLIVDAVAEGDERLAAKLIESVFSLALLRPRFVLNFIDRNVDISGPLVLEPVLSGLAVLLPLHTELVDSFAERWHLSATERDVIYARIDVKYSYRAYEYLAGWNMAVYSFLETSRLRQLGFGSGQAVVTCETWEDVSTTMSSAVHDMLRECEFDLALLAEPLDEAPTAAG